MVTLIIGELGKDLIEVAKKKKNYPDTKAKIIAKSESAILKMMLFFFIATFICGLAAYVTKDKFFVMACQISSIVVSVANMAQNILIIITGILDMRIPVLTPLQFILYDYE